MSPHHDYPDDFDSDRQGTRFIGGLFLLLVIAFSAAILLFRGWTS